MVLDRRFCSLLLLLVSMLFVMATRADAQNALWNLALTNASQTVSSGTSGLVVYDGNISNTDSSNTFNLIGDSITTTNWHSSLSVVEDPLFMNFLNNVGSIPPGSTYTGAIIDVIYTSATPATLSGTPYTGSIDITTDGIPTDVTSNFALAVSGAPPVPESSSFAGLCALLLLSGLLLGLMRRYSARGNSGGGTVWLCAAVLCVACAHAATAGGVTGTINDVDYLKAQPGGYQGTSYPRWQDAAGNDLGQLVYPQDQDLSLCMVMDTNTGTLVSAGTPYGGGNGGNAMFSFAYLPAGTHKLELIEPFRDEYFQPISKIVTVNVPTSGTATATFNVVRNWQFSVIDKFPTGITGRTFFGGMSTDFVSADIIFAASNGLAELRAVTPLRTYSMRPGTMKWGGAVARIETERAIDRTKAKLSAQHETERLAGTINLDRISLEYWHECWTMFADDYGVTYEKIDIPEG